MQTVAPAVPETKSKKRKSKSKKTKKIIAFDEEIVTKSAADKIISEQNLIHENATQKDDAKKSKKRKGKQLIVAESDKSEEPAKKKKRKRKKDSIEETSNTENSELTRGAKGNEEDDNLTAEAKRHKNKEKTSCNEVTAHKKKRNANKPRDSLPLETQSELNPSKPSINKEESIRARKRRVHADLLQKKRLHNEAEMQKKCLNYLSKWKHDRAGWKFEKLKQFWLSQNLWDDAKVPDEFFEGTVEYFESAKGKARDEILKSALEIVEKGNNDDNTKIKYERARMLVQSLQE